MSVHDEQVCSGLWCGGGRGGILSRKLQCEYISCFHTKSNTSESPESDRSLRLSYQVKQTLLHDCKAGDAL